GLLHFAIGQFLKKIRYFFCKICYDKFRILCRYQRLPLNCYILLIGRGCTGLEAVVFYCINLKMKGEMRMGLDMFLYSYEETEKKDDKKRVHWIEWRKANAIHWWFVSQIQGGVDEGDEYPVPREKLV